MSLQYKQSK